MCIVVCPKIISTEESNCWERVCRQLKYECSHICRSVLVSGPVTSDHSDGQDFSELVSQIVSMSFESTGLHWRYISSDHGSLSIDSEIFVSRVSFKFFFIFLWITLTGLNGEKRLFLLIQFTWSYCGLCFVIIFFLFRYNLMANRVLLLLAMASRSNPNSSPKILCESAGLLYFLCFSWFPHFCYPALMLCISFLLKPY